ncbi:MAG: hypothetical protein E5X67_35135 [Mesorhizobium sp.]|uniref:hypothetical protein n=1 Tax=Mesorhizobium sp. TaxID=1871066 RepID=UPI00121ECF87|nr:hypothetical protein [Mesorhizobium sp.]TIP23000.1 MAG: hypothetical protein E5X67_35135 [Mesorhizobium sp.]
MKTGADVTAANLKDKRIGVLQGSLGADWLIKTLKPSVESVFLSKAPVWKGPPDHQIFGSPSTTRAPILNKSSRRSGLKRYGRIDSGIG